MIVVHYRREDDLDVTLQQFDQLPSDWPRIVVSNGTTDRVRLRDIAARHGARLVELDNPGYAAAVNAGVAAAGDVEYVCVLTHEVRLGPGCLEELVGVLVADPEVGLVGPLVWNLDEPERVWSAGGELTPVRRIGRNLRSRPRESRSVVRWVEGCCWAMRSADLRRLGGHEERYFLYMEDVDLGLRVRATLGLRIECVTSAQAWQSPGGTMTTFLAVRNLLMLHSRFYPWLLPWDLLENAVRLLIGPVLRPRGARRRFLERLRGMLSFRQDRWTT